jgi:hypothetical protein
MAKRLQTLRWWWGVRLPAIVSVVVGLCLLTAPLTADAHVGKLERRLVSHKGLWFEYDYDNDGVCTLYSFRKINPRVHGQARIRGIRRFHYVNPFTGQCQFAIGAPSPVYCMVATVKRRVLRIRPCGRHVTDRIHLRKYPDGRGDWLIRHHRRSGWLHNCRSPYFPSYYRPGC